MAFLSTTEVHDAYVAATKEADQWRENYPEYERLADNGLMDALDPNLPEVNDGSLAAALFKLPKRIVNSKLTGRAKATDRQDAWITELANLQWENKIIKGANSQAPFHRKIKDVVRKAAIYGGQPVVTLFVENGNYTGSDMIAPPAQDVKLEAGKVSDSDSDIIFWDLYYSKLATQNMRDEAIEEMRDARRDKAKWEKRKAAAERKNKEFNEDEPEPYNTWFTDVIDEVLASNIEEGRSGNEEQKAVQDKGVQKTGYHFYIAYQRGVNAPFKMMYGKKVVREWSNPDPSGDTPVHYLYCYQDFINPYGIGIVKLAGGTQNVLDYMRKADILATQIGLRPPKTIRGNTEDIDVDSFVYTEDANWETGEAEVTRMELSDGIYNQLPGRIQMYKQSLNQLIPMGDTSISAGNGDPLASKTPAGVKASVASLSIDDDDFKDNLYMFYEAVVTSMINTQFANMMGNDTMTLTDEEVQLLSKAGIPAMVDEYGHILTNELDIEWDLARATFNYEVEAENDKTKDDATKLEGLKVAADFLSNPNTQVLLAKPELILGNKKINIGELIAEIISLATDNDKIVTDITPEDKEAMAAEQPEQEQPAPGMTPEELALKNRELDIKEQGNQHKLLDLRLKGEDMAHRQGLAEHAALKGDEQQEHNQQQDRQNAQLPATQSKPKKGAKKPAAKLPAEDKAKAEHDANVQAVMQEHQVPLEMAEMMVTQEEQGVPAEDILAGLERFKAQQPGAAS